MGAAVWLSAAVSAVGPLGPIERTAYLMDTRVNLVVWTPTRDEGHARLEVALELLEQTERELSTWRDDSLIAELNKAPLGVPRTLEPSLCALFGVLDQWQASSRRAFDPAIGPLLDAWDIHGEGRVPAADEVVRALEASGFERLAFDAVRCTVTPRTRAAIDVGAFGKGEAIDRAARALGDGPWMIDLGGQIGVGDGPPGEQGWTASIAHPRDRAGSALQVRIASGSLSTSGGSERDLEVGDGRVGHILDPRTGQPAAYRGSVTVWHRSALVADILSTALYVMGPAEGLAWAEDRGIAACYLPVDPPGRVEPRMSAAFRRIVISP
jgi:thiamine biosynthesis lipoprotein